MSISLKGYKNLEKISEGIKITIYRGERIRDRQAVTIALLPDRDRSPIELKFDDHRLMFPSDSIFGGRSVNFKPKPLKTSSNGSRSY